MKRFLICAALMTVACEPMVAHRGHVQHADMLGSLETGTSQDDVRRTFGSPSSRSTYGPETWYYIQARKATTAFFKPEITEQDVIAVRFDADGLVESVDDFDLEDRLEVVMVDDITPTEGHSIGFFEQVLGNLGRFNSGPGGAGPGGTRGPTPGPVGR